MHFPRGDTDKGRTENSHICRGNKGKIKRNLNCTFSYRNEHIKKVCWTRLFPLYFTLFWSDTADYVSFKFCWHSLFSQDLLPRKKASLEKNLLDIFKTPKSLPVRMSFKKSQEKKNSAWLKKKASKKQNQKTHHSFTYCKNA